MPGPGRVREFLSVKLEVGLAEGGCIEAECLAGTVGVRDVTVVLLGGDDGVAGVLRLVIIMLGGRVVAVAEVVERSLDFHVAVRQLLVHGLFGSVSGLVGDPERLQCLLRLDCQSRFR